MKKTNYSKSVWLNLFCIALLLLITGHTQASVTQPAKEKQTSHTVSGTVTDEDGTPIAHVAVVVKGRDEKVMTSEDGKYEIPVNTTDVLTFLCGGYRYKEMPVDGQTVVDVTLTEVYGHTDYLHYDNILYGQQSKTLTTGAYSQILGEEVETRAVIHNSNRYTGMLAGLFVMQNNGEPGSESATMWIRGKRTFRGKGPVVLVDGYERDAGLLDPNEIETITVLKDAAATARYGLRGGNGILQITTKRGEEGKIRINVHARAGIKAPTTNPQLLDSYDYASLYNEAQSNDGILPENLKYTPTHLAKYMQAREGTLNGEYDKYLYPNINWYDDYLKKHTWQQRYSMSVEGGNKYARYFVSFGFTNNSGLYNVDKPANTYNTNADQKLYTVRSNVDVNVTPRFSMSLDLGGRQEEKTFPGDYNESALRVFRALYRTPPNAHPVFQPGLTAAGKQRVGGTKDYTSNPYGIINLQGYSLDYTRSMYAALHLKYKLDFITQGLNIKGAAAFDSWYAMTTKRNKNFKVYDISTNPDGSAKLDSNEQLQYIETGSDTQMASGKDYRDGQRTLDFEIGLNYGRQFGGHGVYAEALFSQREISQENNKNVPRVYRGIDGRVSYNYKERYLAEFNFGYQGSEQMMASDKFGFFPAVSAGWVITNENFLKNNKFLNFLKIRGSYGIVGWDDIGGYFLWYQQFASTGGASFGSTSVGYSGWNEGAFALDNVTWEKNTKIDVGLDTRLWNNRIYLTFDYFHEHNKDIMYQPALPYIMGIRFPDFPVGVVTNKGFEFSVGYADRIGEFEYSISGVFTKADNTVDAMGEETKPYSYQQRTGKPLDPVFGLVDLGLFQSEEEIANSPKQTFTAVTRPGDIKYKDINGDGVIDAYDEVYLGLNADPNIQWGINLGLKFKGFDFTALVTGQDGGTLGLTGESVWEFHDNGTVREHHLERFNPNDPSSWATAAYPRLSLSNKASNQRTSTYWRKSIKQVRLKHIELGYTFPKRWVNAIRLQNIRCYVNGYNLYTWQSTDLLDVEARSGHYVLYPIQWMANFGLQLTF